MPSSDITTFQPRFQLHTRLYHPDLPRPGRARTSVLVLIAIWLLFAFKTRMYLCTYPPYSSLAPGYSLDVNGPPSPHYLSSPVVASKTRCQANLSPYDWFLGLLVLPRSFFLSTPNMDRIQLARVDPDSYLDGDDFFASLEMLMEADEEDNLEESEKTLNYVQADDGPHDDDDDSNDPEDDHNSSDHARPVVHRTGLRELARSAPLRYGLVSGLGLDPAGAENLATCPTCIAGHGKSLILCNDHGVWFKTGKIWEGDHWMMEYYPVPQEFVHRYCKRQWREFCFTGFTGDDTRVGRSNWFSDWNGSTPPRATSPTAGPSSPTTDYSMERRREQRRRGSGARRGSRHPKLARRSVQ